MEQEENKQELENRELSANLTTALHRVERWEEDGTLDNLDTLLHFFNAALNSMTPEIVDGLVATLVQVMELGDQVMQSKVFKIAPELINVTNTLLTDPPETKHGMRYLMKSIREPEVQDGIQFMLAVLKEVGKGVNGKTS